MDICVFETSYFDHPIYRMVISVVYSASSLIATVLNSLILLSIWKTPSLHNPSFMLIANLAVSDLINGAIGKPLMISANVMSLEKLKNTFCYVWKSARAITYCTASVSLETLALISLDRLLAVKLMNRYRSVVTLKRVRTLMVVCWVVSFCLTNIVFPINVKIEYLKVLLFAVVICMIILLSTVSVCYIVAFCRLRKISSSISNSSDITNAQRPYMNITKYRKSLKTMLLLFAFIMLFYTPYACMAFVSALFFNPEQLSKDSQFLYLLFLASEALMICNSSVNPLLYLLRMQEMREAVKTTVEKILNKERC